MPPDMSFLYCLTTDFPADGCVRALLAKTGVSHEEPATSDNSSPAAFPGLLAFKIKQTSPTQLFPTQTSPDSTFARQSHQQLLLVLLL